MNGKNITTDSVVLKWIKAFEMKTIGQTKKLFKYFHGQKICQKNIEYLPVPKPDGSKRVILNLKKKNILF